MTGFEAFHFLRPSWLVPLLAIGLVWWLVRRRDRGEGETGSFVAEHLREALTVNRDAQKGFRPVDAVAIALVAITLAAAGPTWRRQPSPWFAETAPLVVALEVTDSMRSNDLQPTRLDRARLEILDLAAARTGSRTALIAYAGSAHVVLPPSKDLAVIQPFLESLDPAIMPTPGANTSAVLPLARALLGEDAAIGTLLFVGDGFEAEDVPALSTFAQQPAAPALAALIVGDDAGGVALMPDGTPAMAEGGGRIDTRIDSSVLRRVASEADVAIVRAEAGEGDLRQLLRAVESNLQQSDDPDARWRDEGWWLLWPPALLTLLWFRRGWTMRW